MKNPVYTVSYKILSLGCVAVLLDKYVNQELTSGNKNIDQLSLTSFLDWAYKRTKKEDEKISKLKKK